MRTLTTLLILLLSILITSIQAQTTNTFNSQNQSKKLADRGDWGDHSLTFAVPVLTNNALVLNAAEGEGSTRKKDVVTAYQHSLHSGSRVQWVGKQNSRLHVRSPQTYAVDCIHHLDIDRLTELWSNFRNVMEASLNTLCVRSNHASDTPITTTKIQLLLSAVLL